MPGDNRAGAGHALTPRALPATLVSYNDAAKWLGISNRTLRRRIADGDITPVRLGNSRPRIRTAELERYVNLQETA